MNVWFTSDLHIGHRMVAGLRGAAAGVPVTVDEDRLTDWHDNLLANNWDAYVMPDDQIWVLGDISAGGKSSQLKALAWLGERPGEKHLIAGNHDGIHPMNRDSHKWVAQYAAVFASVQPFARRNIPRRSGKQVVLLSHFPYEGEGERPGPDRYTQYRLRDEGLMLLHGHSHSAVKSTVSSHQHPGTWEGVPGLYAPARQIHVGLDAWELRPVKLEELVALIEEGD